MFNSLVIAALVELLAVLVDQYLPGFPVSKELINAIVVALLGLFGFEVLKVAGNKFAAKFMASMFSRGLIK